MVKYDENTFVNLRKGIQTIEKQNCIEKFREFVMGKDRDSYNFDVCDEIYVALADIASEHIEEFAYQIQYNELLSEDKGKPLTFPLLCKILTKCISYTRYEIYDMFQ